MSFSQHSFIDFSAQMFRKPGIADACLFVQERYGLNVNLVLFCVWVADCGGGSLTAEHLQEAWRRLADWHKQVIKPLRDIRRVSRNEALGIPEFLRDGFVPQVEAAEQEAERVAQYVLAEFARTLAVSAQAVSAQAVSAQEVNDRAGAAMTSLMTYMGELDIVSDRQLTECLDAILQTVFGGTGFPAASMDG